MAVWILLACASITGAWGTVEVHFENKDGGFFLKQAARQQAADLALTGGGVATAAGGGGPPDGAAVLSVDRFTVFQTSQPMSVRATYGPFSTKQTVPARYIVPDPVPVNASSLSLDVDLSGGHHLDMSAHLVRPEVPRDSPVLRVLFHTGADPRLPRHHQVCIVVHASLTPDRPALTAACAPDGEEGVCLAELTVPASWWPPLPLPDPDGRPGKPVKTPPRSLKVSYTVLEPRGSDPAECAPRVQIQPVTPLASVPLTHARAAPRELRLDEALTMLLPHAALFPRSRLHVPVFLHPKSAHPVTGFILRARVKSGLRVLGAECSNKEGWNMSLDVNPKHTVATVTAFRRTIDLGGDKRPLPRVEEVLSWLLEVVEDSAELWDEGRIAWSVRYVADGQPRRTHHSTAHAYAQDTARKKVTARLDIQKDDIQAVLPISKNWEVMNTAVLTGRQVSQAMKVFIVSQAGKAADVTLQSSCHSEDESVLKVSSSCSSVYVDGSEIRGSWNASVLVKYGSYTGVARFTLWMPEFPLEIAVPDYRLSQIKGWRLPDHYLSRSLNKIKKRSVEEAGKGGIGRWGGSGINAMVTEDVDNGVGTDDDKHNPSCRLRYQQTPVEVYARFLAADHDSGRVSYFVSRRSWLRVTDLVLSLLRVSDPRIATLHGHVVQGRSIGRTEVQVLSAITGRVIGAKEVRVGSDRVSVTKLRVNIVSGLQLNISPDSAVDNGYIAETSVTRKLTAQYQEGLLDMEVEFSDGSGTPLRDVSLSDYSLVVDSLSPDVVAFAPNALSHPRVIAVGEGRGELLRVALLTPDECRTGPAKRTPPLVSATAQVQVDFAGSMMQHRPDFVQNDGGANGGRERNRHRGADTVDLHDILIAGIPLKDENNHEPTVQARQHHGGGSVATGAMGGRHHGGHGGGHLTPLEIGMYVLLAAFCFAIVVFVVSCVVYASKFKPHTMMPPELPSEPVELSVAGRSGGSVLGVGVSASTGAGMGRRGAPPPPQEPTTNAHDWVWLGRATLERASGMLVPATANNNAQQRMRITHNPLPTAVDSATYCKERPRFPHATDSHWTLSETPPPLPPHGVPMLFERVESGEAEYRPPVPPHRNMRVTRQASPSPQLEPELMRTTPSPIANDNMLPRIGGGGAMGGGGKPRGRGPGDRGRHHHHHHHHHKRHGRPSPDAFVEFNASSPSEVKRATVVGNPMFSAEEDHRAREDMLALEDLNLGMDYRQIMEYFDNLKESNA